MEVTLLLQPEVARSLGTRELAAGPAQDLLATARTLGLLLVPLHPQAADTPLASYYTAHLPAGADVQQVLDELQKCRGVRAAYVKPPDALP